MHVRNAIVSVGIAAVFAAWPSVASVLDKVPCEPYPSLSMKMAGVVYEATTKQKMFDVTSSSDRADQFGPVGAGGWRTVEYSFQETDVVDGKAVKPWRQRIATAQVRWEELTCELADLEFVRDWQTEVTEHVAYRCFRYYAASVGLRGDEVNESILSLRLVNGPWIAEMVDKAASDSALYGEGRSLGMFYGQFRLACEAEIDAGRLPFRVQ